MEGFSDTLLKNHFTLYQGYVTNTNKLIEILHQMLKEGKAGSPQFAELKRADYLEAFFKNIQWRTVEGRLR